LDLHLPHKNIKYLNDDLNIMKKQKCSWCLETPLYEAYHDHEWGVPVFDDQTLFEFLVLETFQAGLSWITILKKRAHFKEAFDQFNYIKIAEYDENKINKLLTNSSIVRNKLKIKATVSNAKAFIEIQKKQGSFSQYFWGFTHGQTIKNKVINHKKSPANTALSNQISNHLKAQGFKFVGSTVIYAFMQAVGMVNDHEISCFRYHEV